MKEKPSVANDGEIKIPKAIKDRLKELSLIISDTMQFSSKTERTAFLFMIIMLLKDYVVFSTISQASTLDDLNKYINDYQNTETDPIARATG